MSELTDYQANLAQQLRGILHQEARTEWSIETRQYNIYSPVIDVAVGPFATDRQYIDVYDELMDENKSFIESLIELHNNNLRAFSDELPKTFFDVIRGKNRNSRCFMAVEIENKVSRKHLMGGAVNASAMGRIGVLVPWTDEKFRAMVKLIGYFRFLTENEKNTFDTTNILVIKKDQLIELCRNRG